MLFHGLLFFLIFHFLYEALLLAWILATLHYTTTVAMATDVEAANSTAAGLAGAAAASWARGFVVHGKVGAWVCRCTNALVHECTGVGVHGCKGRHPTEGTALLWSLAGMSILQRATSWEPCLTKKL